MDGIPAKEGKRHYVPIRECDTDNLTGRDTGKRTEEALRTYSEYSADNLTERDTGKRRETALRTYSRM
jgi:hypothetical protein